MAMPPLIIEIPNGPEVNFVIGRGGASINALQAEAGCHIAVQKANEVPPGALTRQVTITGASEEHNQRCAALIQAKVHEYRLNQLPPGPAASSAPPPTYAPQYGAPPPYGMPPPQYGAPPPGYGGPAYPPPSLAGPPPSLGGGVLGGDGGSLVIEISHGPEVNHLIGVRGASINALQAETGTHIAIQKVTDMQPGAKTRGVTISGGDEAARERCSKMVHRKVEEHRQSLAPPSPAALPAPVGQLPDGGALALATSVANNVATNAEKTQTLIEIPNGPEVNHLIGQKGASINALQNETGTHISVQKADAVAHGVTVREVIITGEASARALCADLVRKKIAEYSLEGGAERATKRMRSAPPPAYPPPRPPPAYPPYAHDPYASYPYAASGYAGYSGGAYAPPPPASYAPPPASYAPPPRPPPPGYAPDPYAVDPYAASYGPPPSYGAPPPAPGGYAQPPPAGYAPPPPSAYADQAVYAPPPPNPYAPSPHYPYGARAPPPP